MSILTKFKPLKLIYSLLLLIIIILGIQLANNLSVSATSINSLTSQVQNLKGRVNQLESQVRRLSQNVARGDRSTPANPPPSLNNSTPDNYPSIETTDPMFQRLATLVIELKEQLRELETRMTQLEIGNS